MRTRVDEIQDARTGIAQEMVLRFRRVADQIDRIGPAKLKSGQPKMHRAKEKKERNKHRRADSETDTSNTSGSDGDGSSDSDSDVEKDRVMAMHQVPIRLRKKGPKCIGIKEIKPGNSLYTKIMSYRLYRLRNRKTVRTSQETGKVRDFLKRMELPLKKYRFSGTDPIRVLDFLARFVKEAYMQRMSEAQAFIALPSFLEGFALSQHESGVGIGNRRDGGIYTWPYIVQYLQRRYAQPNHISNAIIQLRAARQNKGEIEQEFARRLNEEVSRYSNVHESDEIMTLFVEGLNPEIRSLIQGYRDNHQKATYLELIQQAR